jgi:hexosaminidase
MVNREKVPESMVIIPTPKKVVWNGAAEKAFGLGRTNRMISVWSDNKKATLAVNHLYSALRQIQSRTWGNLHGGIAPITMIVKTSEKADIRFVIDKQIENPEKYVLHVASDKITITASAEKGWLWGVQTLLQLIKEDSEDHWLGFHIPCCQIEDWPTLSVRAVHLFHGQNALDFHSKLIERVFSPFKLNAIFIQCEQLKWDFDPSVAPSWGGSKADIKAEIALAKKHGITVYPLIQSYGHMEWLFSKPQNKQFAEDPATPYAVNITNPKAVKYLEGFCKEADTLFNAPGFHAGLDEVTMRGKFPLKSAPRTFSDLFISNTKYWNTLWKSRKKQMWMWADMAMHPSEVKPSFGTAPTPADAQKLREGLPKDIVMVDWQYGAHSTFPSLKKLQDAGFTKLVAATWFNPKSIQNFSKAAAEVGALGAMQTTWCGYESKEEVLDGEHRKQFVAMILAAEYFWNGGDGPAHDKLPYDPNQVFDSLFPKKEKSA